MMRKQFIWLYIREEHEIWNCITLIQENLPQDLRKRESMMKAVGSNIFWFKQTKERSNSILGWTLTVAKEAVPSFRSLLLNYRPLLYAYFMFAFKFSGTEAMVMQTSGTDALGKACTPLHGEAESWMTCLPAIYGLVIKIQFTGECSILINCPVTAWKLTKGGSYMRFQTVCRPFLIMTTDSTRISRWKKSFEQFTKRTEKDLTV